MKMLLILLGVLHLSCPAQALIYGTDDRQEALRTWAKPYAKSVLLMAPKNYITDSGDPEFVKLDFEKVSGEASLINQCSNEKFAQQVTAGINCSGFLIAPDLVVTAGHCIVPYGSRERIETPGCAGFVWIADYAQDPFDQLLQIDKWPRAKIFECAEVIQGTNPDFSSKEFAPPLFGDDYALIRLKKPVTDRRFLKMSEKPLLPGQSPSLLYVLGYPLGLPLKLAGPARVIDYGFEKFYSTNLDAFMGNSGSPVMDDTGLVHGILVRGYPDDFLTNAASCYSLNSCNEAGTTCKEMPSFFPTGEHVQRLNVVFAAWRKYEGVDQPIASRPAFFKAPVLANMMFSARPKTPRPMEKARPRTLIDPNQSFSVKPRAGGHPRSAPVLSAD